jgi:hypothetical protein
VGARNYPWFFAYLFFLNTALFYSIAVGIFLLGGFWVGLAAAERALGIITVLLFFLAIPFVLHLFVFHVRLVWFGMTTYSMIMAQRAREEEARNGPGGFEMREASAADGEHGSSDSDYNAERVRHGDAGTPASSRQPPSQDQRRGDDNLEGYRSGGASGEPAGRWPSAQPAAAAASTSQLTSGRSESDADDAGHSGQDDTPTQAPALDSTLPGAFSRGLAPARGANVRNGLRSRAGEASTSSIPADHTAATATVSPVRKMVVRCEDSGGGDDSIL